MERAELVFIAAPTWLVKPVVKFAQLLIDQNDHLSIRFFILIMKLPSDTTIDNYIESKGRICL
ncbi:hypothetical protein CCACVL1_27110, partial [Corchorus capsularis]